MPRVSLLTGCVVALWATLSVAQTTTAPKFDNLGRHHRPAMTKSTEAQTWFDQGINLYFGFNHEEAIRSFEAMAAADPESPMSYWGISMSHGPNINNPVMDEDRSKAAYDAMQLAVARRANGSPAEQMLVDAIAARFTWPAPEDRSALDRAYADAMAKAWAEHPKDTDIGAWYAEALMDLRPWDLWTADGTANPGTERIVEVLETVLKLKPDHPGACHFYIHTMEASPTPEKALTSANILRHLVPGAGHLVHMPGHIDIRLGNYNAAITANQQAIAADRAYVEATGHQGFYTLYRAHNYHFLAWAAMYEGRRQLSVDAALEMFEQIPLELVRMFPDFLDAFLAVPVHVMVRFGMWNELLAVPTPPADLQAWTAMWRYGRTVAFASLNQVENASAEFELLRTAIAAVPESRTLGNNRVLTLLEIGRRLAEGELEYRLGNHDRAFALLREAVELDDALRYDEPWGWMQPVRHALGALLLEQNQLKEAEAVYRADLELHPENGWALHGLHEALERAGRTEEATLAQAAFDRSWVRADITIQSSCYCRRGL